MGFVSSLKFDSHSGAILVNEEFMNVRYRRKMYLDAAQSLLAPDMADAWGMEAIYAGVGSPWLNQEIIDTTRHELVQRFRVSAKGRKKSAEGLTLREVSEVAGRVMRTIVRRDKDLKLKLFYGFDGDALNKGTFVSDGETFSIKQDKVKNKALDVINGTYADRNTSLYNETRGHVFGYDQAAGVSAYHLDVTNGNVGFNMEAYESLGHGKYAIETSLAAFLNNISHPMRQRGHCRILGIYELLRAAIAAREAFHCTGGNVNITFLDGRGSSHSERVREVTGETSRVALHIVVAAETEYVSKRDAFELLDAALFRNIERSAIENDLLKRSSNSRALDLILRGYKKHEVAEMAASWTNRTPSKGSSRKRSTK